MKERFEGEVGKRLLIEVLNRQAVVCGDPALAADIAESVEMLNIPKNSDIITQNDLTNDIFFILTGTFQIIVNGKPLQIRNAGELVGEMTALEPMQKRSATVRATEDSVVAKMSEKNFDEIGRKYPVVYKSIAQVLAKRLLQRNNLIPASHERPRIFIICSTEAIEVARLIHSGLAHDPFDVILWSEGVFKVTSYTLQTLEDEVDKADFAIAVAHGDDITESRANHWPTPRDNVIFELGLFMGRLGRARAILMEPRGERVKLPSDLAGVTSIGYTFRDGDDASSHIAPAINEIRKHIKRIGLK